VRRLVIRTFSERGPLHRAYAVEYADRGHAVCKDRVLIELKAKYPASAGIKTVLDMARLDYPEKKVGGGGGDAYSLEMALRASSCFSFTVINTKSPSVHSHVPIKVVGGGDDRRRRRYQRVLAGALCGFGRLQRAWWWSPVTEAGDDRLQQGGPLLMAGAGGRDDRRQHGGRPWRGPSAGAEDCGRRP